MPKTTRTGRVWLVAAAFAFATAGCSAVAPVTETTAPLVETAAPETRGPVDIVGTLASQAAASEPCLSSMRSLADTSFDAAEAVQNAAVARTAQDCPAVGEYVVAMRAYPLAWGASSASDVDDQFALWSIQAACSLGTAAPLCRDAAGHGLL